MNRMKLIPNIENLRRSAEKYNKAHASKNFKAGDWVRPDKITGQHPFKITSINGHILYDENGPYSNKAVCELWEPRNDEKVIVVCDFRKNSFIGIYIGRLDESASRTFPGYVHNVGHTIVKNVIPFLSIEQFDKIIKGEEFLLTDQKKDFK